MGRHGYSDGYGWDQLAYGRWRGIIASITRGKKGQDFFKELIEALDSLPQKRLIPEKLRKNGEVCAIGSIGVKRGINLEGLDVEDPEAIGRAFGIAYQLVQEIEYENDECGDWGETPEDRWTRIRAWAVSQIKTI